MKTAMDVALDALSRRALTRFELMERLQKKGFLTAEISEVLRRLEEWGYLNDRELAIAVSRDRLKRYSKQRVYYELKRRGLNDEIIEEAFNESYSRDQEIVQCLILGQKYWQQAIRQWDVMVDQGKTRSLSQDAWVKQKVGRKLQQQGYSWEIIYEILSKLAEESV